MSTPASRRFDPKLLRELRQVAAAFFGDDYEVFYADAAHFRVVDARLDGDNVTGDELLVGQRDAGGLVDLQSNPMTRAVKKALRERLTLLLVVDVGLVTSLVQHTGDLTVDVPAVYPCPYHGEGRLLALQDGVVHLLQPLVGLALDERAGHIGVVAGREVNGEDVDDNGLSCLQGAVAALVRVCRLRPAGHDRTVSGAAAPEELNVYLCAQQLARKGLAAPVEDFVFPDLSLIQDTDAVSAGGLDGALGLLDVGDLLLRLGPPEAVEEFAVRREGDAAGAQLVGVDDAEAGRHDDRGVRGAELVEEVGHGGAVCPGAALQLAGEADDPQLLVGE